MAKVFLLISRDSSCKDSFKTVFSSRKSFTSSCVNSSDLLYSSHVFSTLVKRVVRPSILWCNSSSLTGGAISVCVSVEGMFGALVVLDGEAIFWEALPLAALLAGDPGRGDSKWLDVFL